MCFRSTITHKCNDGRVFSDKFKDSKVNTCTGTSDGAKWEYDIDNKLPKCIRKTQVFICEIKINYPTVKSPLQPTALKNCQHDQVTQRKQSPQKKATSLARR